jgi:hypothetical protein
VVPVRRVTDTWRRRLATTGRSGRPLLSLCAMTSAPAARARAFLESWRPLVDEVVVAVDERAHPATTAACAGLADRVYLVPAAMQHMERYLGWLHSACSGQWILRADDDELPGAALHRALPALLKEPEPTHYWLPRIWIYPTPATRLDEGIWQRDIQVRLVRNLPGLWRFTGRLHSNIEVMGASRVLDAPLLHLALLVSDLEERRAKVERYERVQPGLVHESGVSLNSVFVPEDMGDTASVSTSATDAATAAAFLDASAAPPPPAGAVQAVPVAAEEIERWNTERSVSAGAYRARVRLPQGVAHMRAESLQHVQVEVTNLGDEWWPRGPVPGPPIQLGHRWWDAHGEEIVMATVRTPFSETVAPGATTRLTMAIQAPSVTGRLGLRVDVVHEAVRWFDCEERLTVEVTPPYDDGSFAAKNTEARESARAVMPRLLELSSPRSVVDVGCGTGTWLSVARELGIDDWSGWTGSGSQSRRSRSRRTASGPSTWQPLPRSTGASTSRCRSRSPSTWRPLLPKASPACSPRRRRWLPSRLRYRGRAATATSTSSGRDSGPSASRRTGTRLSTAYVSRCGRTSGSSGGTGRTCCCSGRRKHSTP